MSVHEMTGERLEHLAFATELLATWRADRDSDATFRMVRLATLEFHPAEVIAAMTELASCLVGLIDEHVEYATTEQTINDIRSVIATAYERSTTT